MRRHVHASAPSEPFLGIGELQPMKASVDSVSQEELLMMSRFSNLTFVKHEDLIAVLDGAEPMGNDDCCSTAKEFSKRLLKQHFSVRIDVSGRFIENEDRWIMCQSTSKGQELLLASAQAAASFTNPACESAQALDNAARLSRIDRGPKIFIRNVCAAEREVRADGTIEEEDLLQDNPNAPSQGLGIKIP
jgi:hypothetical protein